MQGLNHSSYYPHSIPGMCLVVYVFKVNLGMILTWSLEAVMLKLGPSYMKVLGIG